MKLDWNAVLNGARRVLDWVGDVYATLFLGVAALSLVLGLWGRSLWLVLFAAVLALVAVCMMRTGSRSRRGVKRRVDREWD